MIFLFLVSGLFFQVFCTTVSVMCMLLYFINYCRKKRLIKLRILTFLLRLKKWQSLKSGISSLIYINVCSFDCPCWLFIFKQKKSSENLLGSVGCVCFFLFLCVCVCLGWWQETESHLIKSLCYWVSLLNLVILGHIAVSY